MQQCKICGNEKHNRIHMINERILNRGDRFHYLECGRCGTLQSVDKIEDIGYFYSNYRVFTDVYEKKKFYERIKWKIKTWKFLKTFKEIPLNSEKWKQYMFLYPLRKTTVKWNSKILDVGCGSGRWLEQLAEAGFCNLYGIDKFAENVPKNQWHYMKGEIKDALQMKYDWITLHHSFEHMDNPLEVLQEVERLLDDKGTCIIRIPVMGKYAWREYGVNWYQIDAPRHYFLYTEKALRYLCKQAGLYVYKVKYDSDYCQFLYSEGYRDTADGLYQLCYKGNRLQDRYKQKMFKKALELNEKKDGDQAIFYIKKLGGRE